jgi:hypothetical protein
MISDRRRPNRSLLPALPIVASVAGALLVAGCGAPARQEDEITRVCRDGNSQRAPDANCERGAGGHAFAYVRGGSGAIGDRFDTARSNPGDVSRGGFGMSAHSSASE